MRLLIGFDQDVAEWHSVKVGFVERHDAAIGILDDGVLNGAILLTWHNANSVDVTVYSEAKTWAPIMRQLSHELFSVAWRIECLVRRRDKKLKRHLPRLGFGFEGVRHSFYGPGEDAFVYYMTADMCRWIDNGKRSEPAVAA